MADFATPEQRERAVAYWENVLRPRIAEPQAESRETPAEALDRIKAEGWRLQDIKIGPELLQKLVDLSRRWNQAA